MKKVIKKATAVFLALTMAMSLASCQVNEKEWAYKVGDTEVPAGVYRIFQLEAFTAAKGLVEDSSKSLFEQQIEGKDAADWINDTVDEHIRTCMAAEAELKEMGLIPLSQEDQNAIESSAKASWDPETTSTLTAKSIYGPYGVGYDSFKQYIYYNGLVSLLLEARYGENGTEPISDVDLANYLLDNYYAAHMCYYSVTSTETNATVVADAYNNYVEEYNEGNVTWEDIRESEQYRTDSVNTSPVQENVIFPKEDAENTMPETLRLGFDNTEPGKAFTTSDEGILYFFVTFNQDQAMEYVTTQRSQFLSEFKGEEIYAEMTQKSEEMGIERNDSLIKKYDLKQLEKDVNKNTSKAAQSRQEQSIAPASSGTVIESSSPASAGESVAS
ncbi:hypothetical protein [Solibaculum mannosilyticum]|uniref:hypothetical protein n=1 Tax=Solibaculum mannosilyticum TaxID=2780922 RepID=UPI0036F2F9C8